MKALSMSYKENISRVKIPEYTKKQELFNGISHGLGLLLALAVLIITLVKFFANTLPVPYFLGLLIFVFSMGAVYFVSSLYHLTPNDVFRKKYFRVLDHCTIYLLIAGTYTPICMVLKDTNVIGLTMLIIEWSAALVGIILNAFFFNKKAVSVISLLLYLGMGWLVLFCGGFRYMTPMSFGFILAGGIVYSIGSILYSIGHKNLYFHCIFHVFVLASTIIQTIGVLSIF